MGAVAVNDIIDNDVIDEAAQQMFDEVVVNNINVVENIDIAVVSYWSYEAIHCKSDFTTMN